MKRFSEQFKKKADSIRMRAAERDDLRERITAYMEYHPLPAEQRTPRRRSAAVRGIASEPFKVVRLNRAWVRGIVGVATAFVVVIIPVLAEQSLPGDILYLVKTNITEPLRGQLALSPYDKIQWETSRVERRVAEARLLASEGKLTPQTEASVAQAVKNHTSAAQQEIATLRKSNADDAAIAEINLASALAVQSQVLDSSATTSSSTDGRSIALLAGTVNQVRAAVDATQASATPSYSSLLARTQEEVQNAETLLTSIHDQATDEQRADITRRLADIKRKVGQAVALHNTVVGTSTPASSTPTTATTTNATSSTKTVATTSASTTAATTTPTTTVPEATDTTAVATDMVSTDKSQASSSIQILRSALSDTWKLISYMTDIDVRSSVSIDTLIPVTMTDAERTTAITKEVTYAQDVAKRLHDATLAPHVAAKIDAASSTLAAYIANAQKALGDKNLDGAQEAAHEAKALAADMAKIAALDVAPPVATSTPQGTTTPVTSTSTASTTPTSSATSTEGTASSSDHTGTSTATTTE